MHSCEGKKYTLPTDSVTNNRSKSNCGFKILYLCINLNTE